MSRAAKNIMTQSQWAQWGKQRIADGPRIQKRYEREGLAIKKLLDDQGCSCDPLIVLPQGADGPTFKNALVQHAFDCDRK